MTDKQKAQDTEAFLATLTSSARRVLTVEPLQPRDTSSVASDDETEGSAFAATLTSAARKALQASGKTPDPSPKAEDLAAPSYCLIEANDGEWPIMRSFNNVKQLAARIRELEGRDVVVWAFYGVLLPLSAGPERYILLPGDKAVSVPLFDGGPVKIVDVATLDGITMEPSGYLGPIELRTAMPTLDEAVIATANND